jgi:RNA polymerase sigma-70 factor, ECF subfamily
LSELKEPFDSFEDALLACHTAAYRYARSLARDVGTAEELVQEAYRSALAASHRPVPPTGESIRAWLFTIVRNLWKNEIRQRHRWATDSVDDIPIAAEPLDAQVTRKLLQSEVRHAIDMLPEPFREVILLRDIEGLPYAEIARILACPVGTVMSRLSRAREGLRRVFGASTVDSREVNR